MAEIKKYYCIFTQEIHSVGGMQLYTAGKSEFLEKNGWKTVVFHPDYSTKGCAYGYLDRYERYASPIIELPPVAYSKRTVNNVINWMNSLVTEKANCVIYVESQYDIAALWGELFAKSVAGIHINFNCNEVFRGKHKIYPYIQDFFWFKYGQHALYGLRPDTICKIFEGYKDVAPDESTLFDAVEPDPIQDVEDSRIELIRKADFTIMYLGRIVKGYVPNILKGVAGFAEKYADKTIQFCIVGDAEERRQEIDKILSGLANVSIVYMGNMVPIPRALYDKVDVVIAGAVCAEASARCDVPTIVADCENYNANGVLGYTVHNSMYYEEEQGQTDFTTALVDTLINKSYLNYPYIFPESKPAEEIYSEHIELFDKVDHMKTYFNIDSVKVPINYRKAALLQIIKNSLIKSNEPKNKNDYIKWIRKIIKTIVGIMMTIIIVQILVDPYFHYHKPITKYRLNDERYINDGIARHFDYDAIIIGNSLSQNFSTTQYDKLFGTKSVKLPFSGAGYKEIWESLGRALEYNDGVKEVLVCMDLQDLDREADWERYEGNPTYLYDDNILNDIKYIFNKDAIYRGTLYNLIWTITGHESTSMDEYSSWVREMGAEVACSYLKPVTDDMVADSWIFDEEDKNRETNNLTQNVIKIIEAHPNVKFRLIIPPSSIARWCEYYERGEVQYRIDSLEYAISVLLQYENVEIYGFDDAFDITTDLNKYSDTIHYDSDTNEWIICEVYNNRHNIPDNSSLQAYIKNITDMYSNYHYKQLNKYMR